MKHVDVLRIRPDAGLRVLLYLTGEGCLIQENLEKITDSVMNYELLEQLDGNQPRKEEVRAYLEKFLRNGFPECSSGPTKE